MNKQFFIVFRNKNNKLFRLQFQVYNTDISYRWFDALTEQIYKNNEIYEPDRFYGFPDKIWNEEKIVSELNNCILEINKHSPVIKHHAYLGMSQEQLNHLHHYFENLRGGILSPTEFWINANNKTKEVLERYNVLIHRAEDFYNQKISKLEPRITCTFQHKKRYNLLDHDYQYFTLLKNFGEVYINYCEVGKSLHDLYRDNDDIVGEDNIRPLRYYSADFKVHFHTTTQQQVDRFLNGMNNWWHKNHNYLTSLGFNQHDPKNSIGSIPIATIVNNKLTKNETIHKLCEYNFVKSVEM